MPVTTVIVVIVEEATMYTVRVYEFIQSVML